MPGPIQAVLALLGRLCLVSIFLLSAVGNDVPHFNDVAAIMEAHHVPAPQLLLIGAIVFLIAGSISILVGYKARIGALLLFVFIVMATYYFHNFWDKTNPAEQQLEMVQFMKNLSIGGGLLFIMAVGAGPFSLDTRKAP